ncbi:MAG: hypothetical protein IPJ81_04595 [Chitinophagaceae bacterium]|nr:hypothetical protein [Chitinophagaceae bacterium]
MKNIFDTIKIGFKKISRIPRHQFMNRFSLGIKKYFSDYPTYIIFQSVSACNLQCKHCFINNYGTEITDGVTKIILYKEFLKIAERLKPLIKHCNYFVFSTFEAIINKDLFKMMDYLMEINPSIQFLFYPIPCN